MKLKTVLKNYSFPLILLFSIIIGSILGLILGENATYLKPFGQIFINLLYTIVVPLVFFTISSSIANMTNLKRLGKIFKYMFIVFIVTSLIASIVMFISVSIINPIGSGIISLEEGTKETIDLGTRIVEMLTVSDFSELLSKSHMLPLIIFSILFGLGVSLIKDKGLKIAHSLDILSKVMMKIISIIMYYAPIGLCAYFASLVGEYGPELLGSYAKSMILYYIVCVLYFVIFYTIYAYISGKKKGIRMFFKKIFNPTVTSLGTCSSLASLPSNLEAAEDIGIPKDIREVTLPIGATMHMEGSSMASILKIVFLFGIFGRSFNGISDILIALLIAVLSGVVMSGIPGGGLIGEMLIVSMYGFPLEAFPIIATIGWIVDPPATCLNVVGDVSSSMLMTRFIDGKNWKKKKLSNT